MGVTVRSSHVVSAAPSSSGAGLLTLFHCSSVGSLSWETVLQELLQCGSFPQASVFHELLQHVSLPWGAVLQAQTAPAWVPHRVASPPSTPTPAQTSHGVTASLRHPPAPAWGLPWAAGGYLLHRGPPWAAGGQVNNIHCKFYQSQSSYVVWVIGHYRACF